MYSKKALVTSAVPLMRCLSLFLAAALVAGTGHTAFASAKKTHRHAHNRVAATSVHRGKHSARVRRARLETREESPAIGIPDVPLRRAKLVLLPPLRGSHASLVRQNVRNEADGLDRIEDDEQLNRYSAMHLLVALPASGALRVNPDMPANRRYARPWTVQFLSDLGRAHYARFYSPLQVNSAVRTVAYQRRLLTINGNAAPADGDVASPHLTGAAVDIGKKGLSMSEIAWMRAYLLPLQTAGKLDVEEEFYQSCFHISVYKSYISAPKSIQRRGNSSALIAARMR